MANIHAYFCGQLPIIDDPDPNVSRVALNVHYISLTCQFGPLSNFDISYFLQACAELWVSSHPQVKLLPITRFPYPCRYINGMNWPDLVESSPHFFVNRFIDKVRNDSIATGSSFDVSYATKIIALTFNDRGELLNPVSLSVVCEAEEDLWLSGFNTER